MLRIGIDMGGTKTEGIVLGEQGEVLARRRVPTLRGDYDVTIRSMREMVAALEQDVGQKNISVGVGLPGAVSPKTGLIKNANPTWINGKPFDKDLGQALGREVRIENDANCLAVSEATDGAGKGEAVVFAVILGTGCGGGLVINGKVHAGRNALGGEWGHNPLPWPRSEELPGVPCFCGKKGCLDQWISGTGFVADYRRATGNELTGPRIVARADEGEDQAIAAMDRLADRLARALATVINLLDPDVIVLGGGLSNVDWLYETVPDRIRNYTFFHEIDTPVRKAVHGDSSGVRGAAWLW